MTYETLEVAPDEYFIEDVTYDEAIMYCFTLSVNGVVGWRLPSYDEIAYLRECRNLEDTAIASDALDYEKRYSLTVVPVRDPIYPL